MPGHRLTSTQKCAALSKFEFEPDSTTLRILCLHNTSLSHRCESSVPAARLVCRLTLLYSDLVVAGLYIVAFVRLYVLFLQNAIPRFPGSHVNHIDRLAVHSLECPRVLCQEVCRRMLYVLILDEDLWVHFLPTDWIEVSVALKVPQNFSFLVREPALQNHRLVHQLVGDTAEEVVGHLELHPLLRGLLGVELTRHLLEYVHTDLALL